jgi:hypothetical protein
VKFPKRRDRRLPGLCRWHETFYVLDSFAEEFCHDQHRDEPNVPVVVFFSAFS